MFSSFVYLQSYVPAIDHDAGDLDFFPIDAYLFKCPFWLRKWFIQGDVVFFAELVAGVHDDIRKIAVVREDDQSLRVFVESSCGIDAFVDLVFLDECAHCVRSLSECCHVSSWFV